MNCRFYLNSVVMIVETHTHREREKTTKHRMHEKKKNAIRNVTGIGWGTIQFNERNECITIAIVFRHIFCIKLMRHNKNERSKRPGPAIDKNSTGNETKSNLIRKLHTKVSGLCRI